MTKPKIHFSPYSYKSAKVTIDGQPLPHPAKQMATVELVLESPEIHGYNDVTVTVTMPVSNLPGKTLADIEKQIEDDLPQLFESLRLFAGDSSIAAVRQQVIDELTAKLPS